MIRAGFSSAAVFFLVSCSGASSEKNVDASTHDESKVTPTLSSPVSETKASTLVKSDIPSTVFKEDYASVNSAGGMVIKLSVDELNSEGVIGAQKEDSLYVIYDPTCDTCAAPESLVEGHELELARVPVAFYAQNGLSEVGDYICQEYELEIGSKDCGLKSKGVVENTRYFMVQGIVDLPAVMMPNGWVVEAVNSAETVGTFLKERVQ